jgi:hypothetical protein
VSSFGAWDAGGSLGQRHLVAVVPLLAVPFAVLLREVRRLGGQARSLVAASVVTSVVVTWASSVPWPYPSSGIGNPFAEVALPLWRRGVLPTATLEALGLGFPVAITVFVLLAVAAVVLVARAPCGASRLEQWKHPAIALVVSWCVLAAMARVQVADGDHAARSRHALTPVVDREGRRPGARALRESPEGGVEERLRLQQARAAEGDVEGALGALDFGRGGDHIDGSPPSR